jgi:DNA-binding LacI/PurR family transcriptional regulator
MHQPFDQISEQMVALLAQVVDGQEPASVTLPAPLIQRATT